MKKMSLPAKQRDRGPAAAFFDILFGHGDQTRTIALMADGLRAFLITSENC